jgi:hypothetical protein
MAPPLHIHHRRVPIIHTDAGADINDELVVAVDVVGAVTDNLRLGALHPIKVEMGLQLLHRPLAKALDGRGVHVCHCSPWTGRYLYGSGVDEDGGKEEDACPHHS